MNGEIVTEDSSGQTYLLPGDAIVPEAPRQIAVEQFMQIQRRGQQAARNKRLTRQRQAVRQAAIERDSRR